MTTQTLPEVVIDVITEEIESAYAMAPFDQAQAALKKAGFRIIPLEGKNGNAALRIQEGARSDVSRNGNYVKPGIIYRPEEGNFLVRHSPILESAEEATEAHRRGGEFYPTPEQTEKALEYSVRFPESTTEIPTNRFGEEELTAWAFAEQAKAYGEFLREAGIKAMPVLVVGKDYVNKQEKPFARQLWFVSLDVSSLYGYGMSLSYNDRVRGVRKKTGKAKRAETLPYTQRQIERMSKIVLGIREGRLPASRLEQLAEFLERLKK